MLKLAQLKEMTRKKWEMSCTVDSVLIQWDNYPKDIKRFGDRRRKDTWAKAFAHYAAFCARVTIGIFSPAKALETLFKDSPELEPFRSLMLDSLLESREGIYLLQSGLSRLKESGADATFISRLVQNSPAQGRLQDYPELRALRGA